MNTNSKAANLPTPAPDKMAEELLNSSSQIILDHYSATQAHRVLQMMKSRPFALLEEMWRAGRNLTLTQVQMAEARIGKPWSQIDPEIQLEMRAEAYQAIYPATALSGEEELTTSERQLVENWLDAVSHNPNHDSK